MIVADKATVYELVGLSETKEQLKTTIIRCFGEDGKIQGRMKTWDVSRMLYMIEMFYDQASRGYYPNVRPTREYGIRQQLIYILYCEEKLHNKVVYKGTEGNS